MTDNTGGGAEWCFAQRHDEEDGNIYYEITNYDGEFAFIHGPKAKEMAQRFLEAVSLIDGRSVQIPKDSYVANAMILIAQRWLEDNS